MAPASRLKKAGIKPEGKAVYEMADGRPVEMQYGFARVSFVGAETVAQVIFGPEDCEPLLGVVAFTGVNTGITVGDPRTPERWRRLHAKPLKGALRQRLTNGVIYVFTNANLQSNRDEEGISRPKKLIALFRRIGPRMSERFFRRCGSCSGRATYAASQKENHWLIATKSKFRSCTAAHGAKGSLQQRQRRGDLEMSAGRFGNVNSPPLPARRAERPHVRAVSGGCPARAD